MSEQIEPKTSRCLPECKHTQRDWGHSASGAPSEQKIQPATDAQVRRARLGIEEFARLYGSQILGEQYAFLLRIDADREKNKALEAENAKMRKALERLRDCDWTISLLDRMDAVRDIAREALK